MRVKLNDSKVKLLQNKVAIKGSYSLNHGGLHIALYLTNATGLVIGSKNFKFSRKTDDPMAKLEALIGSLEIFCKQLKYDTLTQPRVIDVVAPLIMGRFDLDLVYKKAA